MIRLHNKSLTKGINQPVGYFEDSTNSYRYSRSSILNRFQLPGGLWPGRSVSCPVSASKHFLFSKFSAHFKRTIYLRSGMQAHRVIGPEFFKRNNSRQARFFITIVVALLNFSSHSDWLNHTASSTGTGNHNLKRIETEKLRNLSSFCLRGLISRTFMRIAEYHWYVKCGKTWCTKRKKDARCVLCLSQLIQK